MDDLHPTIELFRARAEVMDATGQATSPEDAIVKLAAWMDLAEDHLTEDDVTVLADIGAMLFRDGLERRMAQK